LKVPPEWHKWSAETISPSALDASLPHRSPAERQEIANAFLGVATWDSECRACDRAPFATALEPRIDTERHESARTAADTESNKI
jgi:hypothetical protein